MREGGGAEGRKGCRGGEGGGGEKDTWNQSVLVLMASLKGVNVFSYYRWNVECVLLLQIECVLHGTWNQSVLVFIASLKDVNL